MEEALAVGASLLGYVLGIVGGLVLHECSHAAVALLLDLGPRLVTIGRGAELGRRRVGRTWFVLRAIPIAGFVGCLAKPGRSLAAAAVIAAGPMSNLVLLAVLAALIAATFDGGSINWIEFIFGVAAAQAIHVIGTILPYTFQARGRRGRQSTDGYKLLQMCKGQDPNDFSRGYEALLRPVAGTGPLPPPSSAAPELLYQLTRPDRGMADWVSKDVADIMVRLLSEDDLNSVERTFLIRRYELEDWLEPGLVQPDLVQPDLTAPVTSCGHPTGRIAAAPLRAH